MSTGVNSYKKCYMLYLPKSCTRSRTSFQMFHVEHYIYFIVLFHSLSLMFHKLYYQQNYSGEAISANIRLSISIINFNPIQPHDDHIKCKYYSKVFVPIDILYSLIWTIFGLYFGVFIWYFKFIFTSLFPLIPLISPTIFHRTLKFR